MNDAVANIPVPADGQKYHPDDVRPMLEQMVKRGRKPYPCSA
ncbi:portal protein [Escherichia coli O55:H7 str. 3256-97]|nr:portal protein [Escherichia coli O55:H7 str. 3256-97]